MNQATKEYGVVVIGGGHAGCEAALACARLGVQTLLVTFDRSKIAEMSCNPSIGGVGKGQLVRELDALGGEMGKVADRTGIHFKRLNMRRGSAVQSSRCQSDKRLYAKLMQATLEKEPNLDVLEGEVTRLVATAGHVSGVSVTESHGESRAIATKHVVLTAGTFMKGLLHCGETTSEGGRFGERSALTLSESLRALGFRILRLKTGTPPRLLRDSIDFSSLVEQKPDANPHRFSFSDTKIELPQVSCYLGYTNARTHEAIRSNLHRSPLYSGKIRGIGPRYCPSIEDKVVKFPTKERHQIFFEPESLESEWIYPNGISTSLPADVQEAFVRTIGGCEDVKIARHGYAVEYDCLDPRDLCPTLESRILPGLFLAGQVNGTSGYEEAASQGLIAGINAARSFRGREGFVLSRTEAYIGVMIDDLMSLGVTEPYRMFTSRAEYRLSLREDNADQRLTEYGKNIGLIDDQRYSKFRERREALEEFRAFLKSTIVKPSEQVQLRMVACGASPLTSCQSLLQLLKRPELGISEVLAIAPTRPPCDLDTDTAETLEIETKYEGYIDIHRLEIQRLKKMGELSIPEKLDYNQVSGLSIEIREKLGKARPATLADATKISGVTPAAISALLYWIIHRRQLSGSGEIQEMGISSSSPAP